MSDSVNVKVLNDFDRELVKVVAAVLVDPSTGQPYSVNDNNLAMSSTVLSAVGDTYTFNSKEGSHGILQSTQFGVGTVVLEGSINGVVWNAISVINSTSVGAGSDLSNITAAGMYGFDACAPKMRIRLSARTSGNFQFDIALGKGVPTARSVFIGNAATTVQSSSAAAALFLGMRADNSSQALISVYRLPQSLAGNNAASIKNTASKLAKIVGYNAAAAVRYLRVYNKNSAPTVGTDTPALIIPLPPSSTFEFNLADIGYHLTSGLAIAITGNAASNDNTAIAANDILGLNIIYA